MSKLTLQDRDRLQKRYWKIPKKDNGFTDSKTFVDWSEESGYEYGKILKKKNPDGQWSPGNCEWVDVPKSPKSEIRRQELIKQWDDFIIPTRKALEPVFETLESRKNSPPHQEQKPGREKFRYEHPDLVREGIVWTG